jgi:L-ascorbate metabolism protein UlaG (beta-lactamase superfamily)
MHAMLAALAVKLIRLETVIPMHLNTFPVIKADPLEFAELVVRHFKGAKVVILKLGEAFDP